MENKLTFNEEEHRYFLGDKEIPSVSKIMEYITKDFYGDVPEFILNKACYRGSQIHKAIYDYKMFDDYMLDDRYKDYFKRFMEWDDLYKPKMKYQELMLTDGHYAGTIDCICKIGNETWLIDFKTSKELHENLLGVQLYAYYELCLVNGIKIDKLGALHLTKDKYTFKEIEANPELWRKCFVNHILWEE